MVNFKYFAQEIPLEDFHLEGSAIVSGMNKKEAIEFSHKVIGGLEKEGISSVNFYDLIKYSKNFIEDNSVRKRYIVLNQYLLSTYKRKIKKPFFIFIGGTSGAGKDTLSSDLQYYLGIDRILLTDLLRENSRTEMIKKYGSVDKVPKKYSALFDASYRVNEKGFDLQLEFVKKDVKKHLIEQAEREYRSWVHPFYILQGFLVVPGIDDEVKKGNKILAIVNPDKDHLFSRIQARWEREMGPMNDKNEKERTDQAKRAISIKNYIEDLGVRSDCLVINTDSRIQVLHLFGEYLINKLEKLLKKEGIKIIDHNKA